MDSFRLAPEWARQDAVILIWPHSNSDWLGQLDAIEKTYSELSRYISEHQKLILIAYDQNHSQYIDEKLSLQKIKLENIQILAIPTNDTWIRDYGPVIVEAGSKLTVLDFVFNAWGNKYSADKDNAFNQLLMQTLDITSPLEKINTVFEAGNLDINSKGTLLCSSSCFQRKTSSQHIQLNDLEKDFNHWFGCERVLWINNVILHGDDTDGHIDTLARHCDDDIIAYSAPANRSDPNYDALSSLSNQLKNYKTSESTSYELVPLPSPKPIFYDGLQLPATYSNFLIINEYVLVPVFGNKQDDDALKIIDDLFPTREIIDIESNALIQQYGGIHCASMQIPQGFL